MTASNVAAVDVSIFGGGVEGWQVDRIRDRMGAIVGGEWGDEPDAHDEGVEIPVIRVADIRGLEVAVDEPTIRRVKESKLAGRLITHRTVLLEKSGGGDQKPVGRAVGCGSVSFDAICSNFMAKVDCGTTIDPKFIVYALDALYICGVNGACVQQTTGIQNLRTTDYLNTKIAFPLRAEQERIATYLDASCAALDVGVAAKRRQLETLDALRRAVALKAVTQGLNPAVNMKRTGVDWIPEIPSHWELAKLNTLFWFRKGDRAIELTQKYIAEYPGEFPVFSGQTAEGGLMGKIDSFEFDFPSSVIFVTTVGAKAMTTRLVSGRFSLSQNCALIIPWHAGVNVDYFEPTVQALFDFERRSIALIMQPSLRFKDLKKFRVPMPPREEQREIVNFIRDQTVRIAAVSKVINSQVATLHAYRKSLIHECVTGQRRVTEADVAEIHRRKSSPEPV